jgi:hypothetical protein
MSIVVIKSKSGEIKSKAFLMDAKDVENVNKHFRSQNPFFIIEESEVEKYPVELFSNIKIKPKTEKK